MGCHANFVGFCFHCHANLICIFFFLENGKLSQENCTHLDLNLLIAFSISKFRNFDFEMGTITDDDDVLFSRD